MIIPTGGKISLHTMLSHVEQQSLSKTHFWSIIGVFSSADEVPTIFSCALMLFEAFGSFSGKTSTVTSIKSDRFFPRIPLCDLEHILIIDHAVLVEKAKTIRQFDVH